MCIEMRVCFRVAVVRTERERRRVRFQFRADESQEEEAGGGRRREEETGGKRLTDAKSEILLPVVARKRDGHREEERKRERGRGREREGVLVQRDSSACCGRPSGVG